MRKNIYAIAGFIIILLFLCFTYYQFMWYMYPYGVHEWAQADRFSLAVNFYDNKMNFFKPATHNIASINGITGVEFPIQAYIAAGMGHIFGREYISACFRLLDVLICCTGLFFLFLACYKVTRDFVFSIVPPLFIFCSPVYIFYACNYIPDAVSASIVFIAFYYIIDYIRSDRQFHFMAAMFWLTIATLIKTSEGIYLLGFIAYVLFYKISKVNTKKRNGSIVLSILLSILVIVGYAMYNNYLNHTYNSTLFLSSIQPFESWNELNYYINYEFKVHWLDQYLVPTQYLMLLCVLAISAVLLYRDGTGRNQLFLIVLFFIGAVAVAALMGHNLGIHDYYMLSIFFPFIAFVFVSAMMVIHKNIGTRYGRQAVRVVLFTACFTNILFANQVATKRTVPDFMHGDSKDIPWCNDAAAVMFQLHIPQTERIVVPANEPNLALVYCDKHGYNMPPQAIHDLFYMVDYMHDRNTKLMVCSTAMAKTMQQEHKKLNAYFDLLYQSDKISVLRLKG